MTNRLPPATLFGSEVHTVSSSLTGQAYQLAVWLPPSYAASSQPYPVLYLLDGDLLFGAATQLITPLIWGQELPELIVVGSAMAYAVMKSGAAGDARNSRQPKERMDPQLVARPNFSRSYTHKPFH